MKTTILFAMLAAFVSLEINAQDINTTTNQISSAKSTGIHAMSATPTGLGSMIANFSGKISPAAFTPDFLKNKKGWTEKANATNDPKGAGFLLKTLEAGLKSTAFQNAWAAEKPKWEAKASTIKSPRDVEEALKGLGAGLKPEMLKK